MTRKLKALTVAVLAGLLPAGAGCEDHDAEQALVTCRNDLTGLRTYLANQNAVITDLRAQLAMAQGNPAESTKEGDTKIVKVDSRRLNSGK